MAARISSDAYRDTTQPIASRTLAAATATAETLGTNVNLGILLLLTPLIAADEEAAMVNPEDWQPAVARVIDGFSQEDSQSLLRTIQVSSAGGLGTAEDMDVNETDASSFDIVSAMRMAKHRDRIALQYADGYTDFFQNVVPVVRDALANSDDKLDAIADAHLQLLATNVDSLIARKCGREVAAEVQRRANALDRTDPAACQAV